MKLARIFNCKWNLFIRLLPLCNYLFQLSYGLAVASDVEHVASLLNVCFVPVGVMYPLRKLQILIYYCRLLNILAKRRIHVALGISSLDRPLADECDRQSFYSVKLIIIFVIQTWAPWCGDNICTNFKWNYLELSSKICITCSNQMMASWVVSDKIFWS